MSSSLFAECLSCCTCLTFWSWPTKQTHEPSSNPMFSFSLLACFESLLFTYISTTIWHMPVPIKSLAVFLPAVPQNHCISRVNLDSWQSNIMMETFFLSCGCRLNLLWTLNLRSSLSVLSYLISCYAAFVNVTWNWLKSHWALSRKTVFESFIVLNIELQSEVIHGSWGC